MSLDGGFEDVEESFFSRAMMASSRAVLRFQLLDASLQRRSRLRSNPPNIGIRENPAHAPLITLFLPKPNTSFLPRERLHAATL